MPPSDAIAVAGKGVGAVKDQEEQLKGSGESAEEGGEATSNGSMKSPVTPAAVCESNGSPALRWKSYSKSAGHGKLASEEGVSAVVSDSKGKLVINLCGIPRTAIKVSSPSSELKASEVQDMDNRKSDETISHNGNDGSVGAPVDAVGGPQNLLAGSPYESVPRPDRHLDLHSPKCQSKASDLAMRVCRRIRMVRRTLKVSKKPNMDRCRLKAAEKKETKQKVLTEVNGSSQKANGVDKADIYVNKRGSGEPETTGSEDLVFSGDETFSQRNTMERSVVHDVGRSRGKATLGLTNDQQVDHKMGMSAKDVLTATAGPLPADANLAYMPHSQMLVSVKENECTSKDIGAKDHVYVKRRAQSLSHDAGAFSETSKLDVKEETVLETLLRDEAPGYSSGGGSEASRGHKVERSGRTEFTQSLGGKEISQRENSESSDSESEGDDDDCSASDGYDDDDSASSDSNECEGEECDLSPVSFGAPVVNEQVPSVLCDAEGNVWHIGKRAEQARGKASLRKIHSMGEAHKKSINFARKSHSALVQEPDSDGAPGLSVTPYSQQINLNWKWPSDVDYTISPTGDVPNRSMVFKEKAIFVGCIPDGTEKLEELLQILMQNFLERFDFAPAFLSEIRMVKIVKDFAFLELATEKVAHIVLAANQLDVFEWGVNGFHFNIEGCKGTHTSVRPLIEYMPLKPARVIFVGNVPKSRWQKEYLGVFFARILKGVDGPMDCKLVNCVYLLPESCDAYVELVSEIMADAIFFKCIKNPQILKEIGEDVFICRDPSSVPLMSKHKGTVCPQRSLFIGVSAPGQEFKIDAVRKIFEDVLPMISRQTNQAGYLEFISVQPGKDYAFFQFNSESIVDAVMEEYIMNTHLFVCGSTPLSYIILRPPGYERPGARYCFESNRKGESRDVNSHMKKRFFKIKSGSGLINTKSKLSNQLGILPLAPRRFGDEPAKKTDCVMSIGVSPLPKATWNGLPSTGACAADPECMLVIEGLPKGFSYKLLRGALNELFEKSLSRMGLLEPGMLVLRHLDRDANLGVVASLPNAKFVNALLLLRKPLVVAGSEIRLLPAVRRNKVAWTGSVAEVGRGQGEVSCISDDEVCKDDVSNCRFKEVKSAPSIMRGKRARPEINNHFQGRRNLLTRKNGFNFDAEVWCTENVKSDLPPSKKLCRGDDVAGNVRRIWKVPSRGLKGKYLSRPNTLMKWKGSISRAKVPHVPNVKGPLNFGNRDIEHLSENRSNYEDFHEEILHIVSEGGKRKIQTVGIAPKIKRELGKASVMNIASRKRKVLQHGQDSLALKAAFIQKNLKKFHQMSRVL